jgi:membrane protease YdiL (CAAX protease family)
MVKTVLFRARRTSEHIALSLFIGIVLFAVQNFICAEDIIPNALLRMAVSAMLSVLRLGLPAAAFIYMQRAEGFEERKIERREKASVKYSVTLAFLGFAVIFITGIFYSAAFPAASARFPDNGGAAQAALIIVHSVIIPAVFEEYLYRRLLCRELLVYGKAFAVIISALLFALAHFSFSAFPYAFVCGLVLGVVYLNTGSALYTAGIHLANNMLAYVLSLVGKGMSRMDFMNIMAIVVISLAVLGIGAFYTTMPGKDKNAVCENGNAPSSAFLTFPMVVYIFCAALINFI